MSILHPSSLDDICKTLREYGREDLGNRLAMSGKSVMLEAANEIERLRKKVRDLEEMKTPSEQRAMGYAEAQRDMRRALGIND